MPDAPQAPQAPSKPSLWTYLWVGWIAYFLLVEIPAALFSKAAAGTLSVHVYSRWFKPLYWRWIFGAFWLSVGVHFLDSGGHWWSSATVLIVLAIVPAIRIVYVERSSGMFGKLFGKIGSGFKSAWTWVKSHGTVLSSGVMGIGFAFPAAKGITSIIAGLLAGSGGAPVDTTALSSDVGELIVGLLGVFGMIRKLVANVKAVGAVGLVAPVPK